MKGLVYYRINRDDLTNIGVLKKCLAQVEAFKRLEVEIDLVCLSNKGILLNDQLIYNFSESIFKSSFSKYQFYFFNLLPIITKHLRFQDYDFLYFRYALSHPTLIQFLKTAKHQNPSIKIISEMPTFPYDKEKVSMVDRLSLKMDQHYRKKLPLYVDRITHYGLASKIFSIPTIPITNGIDFKEVTISKGQPKEKSIRLIALANWSSWHGLDRLIDGLKNYYSTDIQEVSISLTVIGDGKVLPEYKDLVIKYTLQKVVHFLPPMSNAELDHHFDNADIGIGTLGIHRKNIPIDSSLKHREYCARGIPFLFAGNDLDFPRHLPFVLKCEPTNEPIDLKSLIIFWEDFLKNGKVKKMDIRKYSEDQLDWKKRMKKVINFIEK